MPVTSEWRWIISVGASRVVRKLGSPIYPVYRNELPQSRMNIGIGLGTSHNQNTPEGMLNEIAISKARGADGFVLFSSSSLGTDFLRLLQSEH